jgi:two-component system, OmpR family, response regulator
MRVLIVEDELKMASLVRRGLAEEGHAADVAPTGEDALWMAEAHPYDAIVLDVMLPGRDGFETCRELRKAGVWAPVLMLTARDSVRDRVSGLDAGADDYLTKPFSMRELLARVKAILRRAELSRSTPPPPAPTRLALDGLTVDLGRRSAAVGEQPVALKPREFDLLAFLARHPGQVFTRAQLLEHVWGYDYAGDSRTVDVHVRSLRTKLGDRADSPRWIETVWGVGYRFREAE